MAELTVAAITAAYSQEKPTYDVLAEWAEAALRGELTRRSVHATVSGRAKDVESFVVKALVGNRYVDPLAEIGDKAGVRAIVPYAEDVVEVEDACRQVFDVRSREQKLEALAYDEAGYLGVHLDARVPDPKPSELCTECAGLRLEVQIRTIAQSAWAEISHEQLYKPAVDVPDELKRRIYSLVGLVEVFDREIAGFLADARATPGFREAVVLKPLARTLLGRFGCSSPPDRRLSRVVAAALVPLYMEAPDEVHARILSPWIEANVDGLQRLVDDGRATSVTNPLFRQPEVFMIVERLENDLANLRNAWPHDVPEEWANELAQSWGVRFT